MGPRSFGPRGPGPMGYGPMMQGPMGMGMGMGPRPGRGGRGMGFDFPGPPNGMMMVSCAVICTQACSKKAAENSCAESWHAWLCNVLATPKPGEQSSLELAVQGAACLAAFSPHTAC